MEWSNVVVEGKERAMAGRMVQRYLCSKILGKIGDMV